MYGRAQRVLLRHYLRQALAKSEIARELGVSRRTVYHWIETGQLDRELDNEAVRYTPRPQVHRKIDAFRPIVLARLAEYPKLTATRLHAEIRAADLAEFRLPWGKRFALLVVRATPGCCGCSSFRDRRCLC